MVVLVRKVELVTPIGGSWALTGSARPLIVDRLDETFVSYLSGFVEMGERRTWCRLAHLLSDDLQACC